MTRQALHQATQARNQVLAAERSALLKRLHADRQELAAAQHSQHADRRQLRALHLAVEWTTAGIARLDSLLATA